jgi:hypothetical protein
MIIDLARLRTEQFSRDYRVGFMMPADPERMPRTEPDVESPPALQVRADNGDVFTLGFDYTEERARTGLYEFDVVWNGIKTGEFACKIVRQWGKIRIFGAEGWRTWTGSRFI